METNPCDSKHRLSSNTHRLRGRKAILNPWGQYQGSIQGFRKTKGAQEMICLVTKTTWNIYKLMCSLVETQILLYKEASPT